MSSAVVNGDVATRNFIGVLVVGNCAATAARKTIDYFDEERLAEYPNIDGVVPFVHEIAVEQVSIIVQLDICFDTPVDNQHVFDRGFALHQCLVDQFLQWHEFAGSRRRIGRYH